MEVGRPSYERRDHPDAGTPVTDAALSVDELVSEVENLRRALLSRDLIGQAKGILMERLKVTGEIAFRLLVSRSQHENIKVVEVAQRLVDTGLWQAPVKARRPRA